ncbi:MAG TPA: hypothetical protein VN541_10205 [Tepidisphaeraceae bacterium]|nr:hypothetical protein [Tepidisphaeraceae bacterium]
MLNYLPRILVPPRYSTREVAGIKIGTGAIFFHSDPKTSLSLPFSSPEEK